MELSSDEKREIIDKVQDRINQWIGRPYMTVHEALILTEKHYPFKIHVNPPIIGLLSKSFEQSDIQYSDLYHFINSTDAKTAEENLFRHIVENYLTYCFGG